MSRLVNAPRLSATLALVPVWLALAAGAQAQTHTHRHPTAPRAAHPATAAHRAAHRAAPAAAPKRSAKATHRVPAAGALAALAARAARNGRALKTHPRLHRAIVHTHMAGDPAVSIVDFSFAPRTTTIHVGDTITWTNTGKQPHSATANDHSFDTGVLQTGKSASHTFTTAGTFTYFCIVHPYMKGTVVVLAATTTTTTTPTASTAANTTTTPTSGTTTPTTTSNGQTLPFTGTNDLAAFAIGLLLVAGGFVLRARSRASEPGDHPDS